jgi:hypothetical protein
MQGKSEGEQENQIKRRENQMTISAPSKPF